jgi:hypothetical protein
LINVLVRPHYQWSRGEQANMYRRMAYPETW